MSTTIVSENKTLYLELKQLGVFVAKQIYHDFIDLSKKFNASDFR